MVKLKLVRVAAATAASAGMIVGFSGVAAAHPYHNPGTSSVTLTKTTTVSKNNVGVHSNLTQNASSGDAVSTPTFFGNKAGSATSGNASNSASSTVNGTVSNSTPAAPATTTTSTNSSRSFTATDTKTVSVNNVSVTNKTTQDASSGNATAVGGGSATSGSASNSSTSSTTLNVSN